VVFRQEIELFPHGGRMKCSIAHIAKMTYRKQRRHDLYYSIHNWQCIKFDSVVQLGHGHNNGPWVFPVPGNLEFFELLTLIK
jgi:hypothetical protein